MRYRTAPQMIRRAGGGLASYVTSNRFLADNDTGLTILNKDLVFNIAYRLTDATIPSLPAGWTNILTDSRAGNALRCGYRIATADAEFSTTGTWTNAERVAWAQYRPTGGSLTFRAVVNNNNTGTTVSLDALASPLANSWGINFAANNANVTYDSGVAYTVRQGPAGSSRATILDSNGACGGTYAAQTITASASTTGHYCITLEMAVA